MKYYMKHFASYTVLTDYLTGINNDDDKANNVWSFLIAKLSIMILPEISW